MLYGGCKVEMTLIPSYSGCSKVVMLVVVTMAMTTPMVMVIMAMTTTMVTVNR